MKTRGNSKSKLLTNTIKNISYHSSWVLLEQWRKERQTKKIIKRRKKRMLKIESKLCQKLHISCHAFLLVKAQKAISDRALITFWRWRREKLKNTHYCWLVWWWAAIENRFLLVKKAKGKLRIKLHRWHQLKLRQHQVNCQRIRSR